MGGLSGDVSGDFGGGVGKIIFKRGFGGLGRNGILRVDGPYSGNSAKDMHVYKGPVVGDSGRFIISADGSISVHLFLGDEGRISLGGNNYTSNDFTKNFNLSDGFNTLSVSIDSPYKPEENEMELHPWQKLYVLYFEGMKDTDSDGLSDGKEEHIGTRSDLVDTDGDGLDDGKEFNLHGTDPLEVDTDGDGFSDGHEIEAGTNPLSDVSTPQNLDTDGDGLKDGQEVTYGTDPLDPDSDDDGLNDFDEIINHDTDPLDKDTDNDTLTDFDEVTTHGTNPLLEDTDRDGSPDGYEIERGFDPLDPLDYPVIEFKLTPADVLPRDTFGNAVSIRGNRAVAGARWANGGEGVAYVFRFDGSDWIREAKLTDDNSSWTWFGYDVAINPNMTEKTIIVGAPGENTNSGAAYIFRYVGGTWVQEAKLTGVSQQDSRFGASVAIEGNRAVVGVPWNVEGGWEAGVAYVFRFDGNKWIEEGKLVSPEIGKAGQEFGTSVGLWGERAIVGPLGGAAYIYRFDGSNWVYDATLTASDLGQDVIIDPIWGRDDGFGYSVALQGLMAVVGAPYNDDAGNSSGSAYVFWRVSDGNWQEQAKLTAHDGSPNSHFGHHVDILGEKVIIGAPGDDNESGAAYIYKLKFEGLNPTWPEDIKLTPSDAAQGKRFSPCAIDGYFDRAIVGAPYEYSNATEVGAVYLFDLGS
jgi:hypothetical protein